MVARAWVKETQKANFRDVMSVQESFWLGVFVSYFLYKVSDSHNRTVVSKKTNGDADRERLSPNRVAMSTATVIS